MDLQSTMLTCCALVRWFTCSRALHRVVQAQQNADRAQLLLVCLQSCQFHLLQSAACSTWGQYLCCRLCCTALMHGSDCYTSAVRLACPLALQQTCRPCQCLRQVPVRQAAAGLSLLLI